MPNRIAAVTEVHQPDGDPSSVAMSAATEVSQEIPSPSDPKNRESLHHCATLRAMKTQRNFRLSAAIVTAALIVAAPFTSATAAQPVTHIKPGLYDCLASNGVNLYYLDTYDFTHPGRYGFASNRHGDRLAGTIARGGYKLKGNLIIPTSGPLKRAHDYMRLNSPTQLGVFKNNGQATGIGCYYHKP